MATKKISDLTLTAAVAGDQVEIYRPSAPTSDLRAPLTVPTDQQFTAADCIAGTATIVRTSAVTDVEVTGEFGSDGSLPPPADAEVGDVVWVTRDGGGFFDLALTGTSIVLGYRDDAARLQRVAGDSWRGQLFRSRDGVRRLGGSVDSATSDSGTGKAFTAAATYTLLAGHGTSTGFRVHLIQQGLGVVTLALDAGLTGIGLAEPWVTNGVGSKLDVWAIGNNGQVLIQRIPPDAGLGGGSGDAAPTVVEFAASGNLTAAHRLSNNVDVHAGANSIDFNVPLNTPGAWIIRAYDKDAGATARTGCTISVVGDAGTVNGTAAGASAIREIVAGGFAVVSAIDPTGTAPIVTVTGDIFEPPPSRGTTAAADKSDLRKVIRITGNQTFVAAASFPSGFVARYDCDGTNRSLIGADRTFTILAHGAATVFKNGTALVAQGVPASGVGMIVLDDA